MTKEEKQLIIKDLAARLPYNVIVRNSDPEEASVSFLSFLNGEMFDRFRHSEESYDLRPYLRPMSDMTEEEKKEYDLTLDLGYATAYNQEVFCATSMIDFFCKHYLDYRGLIPKGLAYPASPNMYTIQTGHKC